MRIDNNASVNRIQALRRKLVGAVEAPGSASVDAVELSSRAGDFRAAMEALASAPEVREEQVAALRGQIEQGTFDTAVDALAEKLLKRG